jgi:hypothetical protein
MYITHTAAEHRSGLGLTKDYTVAGLLCYGTYNPAVLEPLLKAIVADNPDVVQRKLKHPFLQTVTEITIGQHVVWVT